MLQGALAETGCADSKAKLRSAPPIMPLWAVARRRLADGAGTSALTGVLLLQRTMPATAVNTDSTFHRQLIGEPTKSAIGHTYVRNKQGDSLPGVTARTPLGNARFLMSCA